MTTPTARPALCGRYPVMTTPTTRPPRLLLLLLLLLLFCQRAVGIHCVQCTSEEAGEAGGEAGGEAEGEAVGEGRACISQPPEAAPCEPAMTVCMTIRTYTPAEDDKRTLVSLVRTCGPTDMGWDCEKGKTERGAVAEVCHDSCDWDGCNHAHTPTVQLLAVLGCLWASFLL
ncbi:uncharacterized protein [Procambarus clarkii]|uniref:uncharacterized protein n=1 Tax=Procambarus clarkii TaxID=6728 RepID=UPI0037438937